MNYEELANTLADIQVRLGRIEAALMPKKRERKSDHIIHTELLADLVAPHSGRYAPSMIEEFLLYWTQADPRGVELWRKQRVFDVPKRLQTWARNQQKFEYRLEASRTLKAVDETPRRRSESHIDTGFTKLFP